MLEEHAQFAMVFGLWKDDAVAAENAPALFKTIPSVASSAILPAMIPLIQMQAKWKMLRDLDGQVGPFIDGSI